MANLEDICLHPFALMLAVFLVMVFFFGMEETKSAVMSKFSLDNRPVPQSILQPVQRVVEEEQEEQAPAGAEGFTEEFNNDLLNPEVDIDASDYESALKNMVLEPEIMAQHQKFNQELMHRVGGTSSRAPVRDDNVDEVPWVGLRRPQYQKINPNDGTARTVPSVKDADDLADYQTIMWKPSSELVV